MFRKIKLSDLEGMDFRNMTVEELRKLKPVLGKVLTKENKNIKKAIKKALKKGIDTTELKTREQKLCEIEKKYDQAMVIKLYENKSIQKIIAGINNWNINELQE